MDCVKRKLSASLGQQCYGIALSPGSVMCSSAQWLWERGAAPNVTPAGNKALQLGSSWQGSKVGEQERRWEPGKTSALCLFWRGWHLQTWWQMLNIKVWEEPTATLIWMCVFIFFSHHYSDHLFEHNASSHPKMFFWHNQPEHYHHHQYPTSNSSYLR